MSDTSDRRNAPQNWHVSTLPNINRFSKLFHCQNQEKIGNNNLTKDPTTHQVCRYNTLRNDRVLLLKATIENIGQCTAALQRSL